METKQRKIRCPKTTHDQYEMYLAELESNVLFRENKFTPENPTFLKQSWANLSQKLNASGGPTKDVAGWKKVFADWKVQVRKRSRAIQAAYKETGNIGTPEKRLTDIEKKLLHLTGDVVVEGISGVPEVGRAEDAQEIEDLNRIHHEEHEKAKDEKQQPPSKKISLVQTVKNAIELKASNNNFLMEINLNLKRLIELKEESNKLKKIKLKAKYGIEFQDKIV